LLLFVLTLVAICETARPALAAPGDVDLGFTANITVDGEATHIRSIVVQPDGKILVGGYFRSVGGVPRIGIARLNSDGSLDTTFTPPAFYSADVYDIHLAADGSVLIAGRIYPTMSVPDLRQLVWLSPDGTNPISINLSNTIIDDDSNVVFTVEPEDGGTLLIGGNFFYISDTLTPGIARISSGGQVVTPLGTNANLTNGPSGTFVNSIARQSDGKLVVGGHFVTGTRRSLIRFDTNGALDGTFNNTGVDAQAIVTKVIVEPGDKILVSGSFTDIGGVFSPKLARLHADGPVDGNHASVNLFSMGAPSTMERQADGRILLVGILGPINNTDRYGIARFNSDFSLDSFYPSPGGTNGAVESVRTQPDGNVLIGGIFTTVAGVARPKMARLLDTPNNAPQLTDVSLSPSVDEGNLATLTGTVSDGDGDALTLSVNWGDGSPVQPFSHASGDNFNHTHTYVDDNPSGTTSDPYNVTVTVTDGKGGSGSTSPVLTVNNVAPTLSSLSLSAATITAGNSVTFSGSVGDAGVADSHTLTINWGDGSSDTTIPMPAAGASPFSTQHQYTAPGSFTIAVSASDDDMGFVSDNSMTVTVNPALLPPNPPTNFNAVVTSARVGKKVTYSASLTWGDNSSNETAFVIQRYAKGKKNACVLETGFEVSRPADTTSYTDATATASTCGYQIRATNANGNSAWVRDMNVGTGVTP
jgi:uncharacterized delta-60 repeat protein